MSPCEAFWNSEALHAGHAISYQWYRGTASDTTNPVGMSWFLNVTPTVTTSYWVRPTNDCPNGATASVTATVTVCIVPSVHIGEMDAGDVLGSR